MRGRLPRSGSKSLCCRYLQNKSITKKKYYKCTSTHGMYIFYSARTEHSKKKKSKKGSSYTYICALFLPHVVNESNSSFRAPLSEKKKAGSIFFCSLFFQVIIIFIQKEQLLPTQITIVLPRSPPLPVPPSTVRGTTTAPLFCATQSMCVSTIICGVHCHPWCPSYRTRTLR